jgi:release factor glutamine methyltransferase
MLSVEKLISRCAIAKLDSELLIAHVLDTRREHIICWPETILSPKQQKQYNSLEQQRLNGVPIAYLLGKKEFYGRDFIVNEQVLVPRPETETMVELALQLTDKNHRPTILDLGTGSGCIAITLSLELPKAQVTASDISETALGIAIQNNLDLNANVGFVQSDMLEQLMSSKFDIICANLPYVPESMLQKPDLVAEPKIALFSGTDGLGHYRKLVDQLKTKEHKPKFIICESLVEQHAKLISIYKSIGYSVHKHKDLIICFVLN